MGTTRNEQPRSTTIKDIARRLGLSYSTVSRALNDKYGVKMATRERVVTAARQMRYRPNAIARGLIARKTRTIGIVIPDLRNPFFPEVAAGIEAAAEEMDYSVLLGLSDWNGRREDRYLDLLIEHRVDGIILAPVSRSAERYREALPPEVPTVYVSSVPEEVTGSYVAIDNVLGGYIATDHLISRGYLPIAFLGAESGSDTGAERRRGYRAALEAAGHGYDPGRVLLGPFTREGASALINRAEREGRMPRALFCENDNLAIAAIQSLSELGYRVPEDVAVVGFDDISWAGLHSVELSTIAQPIHEMGKRALRMLIERIEQGNEPEAVVLEPRLVVRNTT